MCQASCLFLDLVVFSFLFLAAFDLNIVERERVERKRREKMMLKIKRVPTVVSNYQKEEVEGGRVGGCGRNCLNECCIQGKIFCRIFLFSRLVIYVSL